jgi:hypothetical protein
MTRYLVDGRTIVILGLLAITSILLAGASAVFTVQASRRTERAQRIVAEADSLMRDWTARGCAPRTPTLR